MMTSLTTAMQNSYLISGFVGLQVGVLVALSIILLVSYYDYYKESDTSETNCQRVRGSSERRL